MEHTMAKRSRILITGSEGFIGTSLKHALAEEYDVWGLDCIDSGSSQVIKADLRDLAETCQAIRACSPFSVLIHTAAFAHGQPANLKDSCFRINTEMTKNVLSAVAELDIRFVFLSSVAVYGEDRRFMPVSTNDDLRPSTDYGNSKLHCERLILQSGIKHCDILRLTPVYDESHLNDIRKRVYLPGPFKAKWRFWPAPYYSLCHVRTVGECIIRTLRQPSCGHMIQNVADPKPYSQNELLSWFPGRSIPLPTFIVGPLYYVMSLLPRRTCYSYRCMYWKLYHSNTYMTDIQATDI